MVYEYRLSSQNPIKLYILAENEDFSNTLIVNHIFLYNIQVLEEECTSILWD